MSINVFNPCAPFFDMDDKERFGIQGVRKGIVVEIFFTYLVYFTIITIGSVKKIYPPESNLSYFMCKKQKRSWLHRYRGGPIPYRKKTLRK